MMNKFYIFYDERCFIESTDEASILTTTRSLKEMKQEVQEDELTGGCYSYDVSGINLINEEH